MIRENYISDFATLKNAYIEVKQFLEEDGFYDITSLSTTIEEDLGISGDDTSELLEKFVNNYGLGLTGFDYRSHFHSEYELYDSSSAFIGLLLFPFYVLKIITFGKFNLLPPKGYFERPVTDLTFGDMVAWYLAKDFKLRSELNIQLS